jgi:TRAP-type C4-dicarboxylate transport system permease small subunit
VSQLLERLERTGRFAEDSAVVLMLAAMIILAGVQILLRNVFDTGLIWSDQVLRIMVLWVALLGAVAASRDDKHIRIDILGRLLPPWAKRISDLLLHAFTAIVAGTAAWFALALVIDERQYGVTLLANVPSWIFQIILPLGFGLIAYRYLVFCLRAIHGLLAGKTPQ